MDGKRITIGRNITSEKIHKLFEGKNLLLPTQRKICLPIINRLYIKMINGVRLPDIQVSNGMICDGHHRYIAACLAKIEISQTPGVVAHPDITNWKSVTIDEEEWDTPARIRMYLERDARYNDMEYAKLAELLT